MEAALSHEASAAAKSPTFCDLYADVATSDSESERTPGQPVQEVTPELLATVVRQVEFYFSDANLPTDKKLLKQIKKDSQGFVPIKTFANFRKIRALTKDVEVITEALTDSPELILSPDLKSVRRCHPVPDYDIAEIQRRMVIIEDLPPCNTIDSVTELLSEFGKIRVVRISNKESRGKLPSWLTAGITNSPLQYAFVEFAKEEDAINAAAAEFGEDDRHHKFRIQRLTTLQQQHPSWRDYPSSPALRRSLNGSQRNSRDASPAYSRLPTAQVGSWRPQQGGSPSPASRPQGRVSNEYPSRDRSSLERRSLDSHGQRSASSGGARSTTATSGAESDSVWGHNKFHPSHGGDAPKALQKRLSHEPVQRVALSVQLQHEVQERASDAEPQASIPAQSAFAEAAAPALDAETAAAWPALSPGSGGAVSASAGTSPVAMRSYAAAAGSGTHSPMLAPSSPMAPSARKCDNNAFQTNQGPGCPSHPLDPHALAKQAAVSGKPPSSPRVPGYTSPLLASSTTSKIATQAALNAMLADVMAAAELKQKEMDAEAAAGGSSSGGSGGGSSDPAPMLAAAPVTAALLAPLQDTIGAGSRPTTRSLQSSRNASRGTSPSPTAAPTPMNVDTLINKILHSPTNRSAGGNVGEAAASQPLPRPVPRPSTGAVPSSDPAGIDSLISKILTDMPAAPAVAPSSSAPVPVTQAVIEAGAEAQVTPVAAGVRVQALGNGSASEPIVAGEGEDSPATSLGRQLSVVPEGNELERLQSAAMLFNNLGISDSFASADSAPLDRELSLAVRIEIAGSGTSDSARPLSEEEPSDSEASRQMLAAGSLTFRPPITAAVSQPITIEKPPRPGSARAEAGSRSSLPHTPCDGGGSSSSADEEGTGTPTRRRRARRSRRRSGMAPPLVGSPALSDGGDMLFGSGPRDGPRSRWGSSGNHASGQRWNTDGSGTDGRKEAGGKEAGAEAKPKKHTKKDYASWAAATPEYRAEASAKYSVSSGGSGGGAAPGTRSPRYHSPSPGVSPPRGRRTSDSGGRSWEPLAHAHGDGHSHAVHNSKGPDGSRGFAMGRGKPLPPPPRT